MGKLFNVKRNIAASADSLHVYISSPKSRSTA